MVLKAVGSGEKGGVLITDSKTGKTTEVFQGSEQQGPIKGFVGGGRSRASARAKARAFIEKKAREAKALAEKRAREAKALAEKRAREKLTQDERASLLKREKLKRRAKERGKAFGRLEVQRQLKKAGGSISALRSAIRKGFRVKISKKVKVIKTSPIKKKIIPGEVQPAPKAGFILRQERERERLRTKKERGQRLSLKEEGVLAGRTVVQSTAEFGLAVVLLPKTLINLAKNPAQLKKVPSEISKGGKRFGRLLRVSPTEAFVKVGTEIFLLKGAGKTLRVAGKVGTKARAGLDPKFKKIKGGRIDLQTSKGKTTLTAGGPVKKIREPLATQAELAGKKVTAVSAQADAIVGFIRKKRIIRKPIPDEANLAKPVKKLLGKFDRGTISKKELVLLQKKVNVLERSFFADPRGRFRPSRLGLKQREATLFETLSEDVSFKTSKPQVLVFKDIRIQKFPKNLKDVEKALKAGKRLTESQGRRLLAFQNKQTGKFKPIGALTKEPEITLAPGEIIRRKKVVGKTLVDGKVVEFVEAEIVKPTAATKKLLQKEAKGRITPKELKLLKKKLRKETRFRDLQIKKGVIRRRRAAPKPRARLPKRPLRRLPKRRPRRAPRRPPRRPPKRPPRRPPRRPPKRPPKRPPRRPPKRIRRKPPVRGVPPPRRRPPRKPPFVPVATIKALKKKRRVTIRKKKKKQAYKVLARPLKRRGAKKRPRLVKVSRLPLTKRKARDLRNYIVDTSLSRTARIKKTGGKPKRSRLNVPTGYARKTTKKFRRHRTVKGKRKLLPKGKVIERSKALLDTKQEKKKITLKRRIAQITKKPVKRKSIKVIKRKRNNG